MAKIDRILNTHQTNLFDKHFIHQLIQATLCDDDYDMM